MTYIPGSTWFLYGVRVLQTIDYYTYIVIVFNNFGTAAKTIRSLHYDPGCSDRQSCPQGLDSRLQGAYLYGSQSDVLTMLSSPRIYHVQWPIVVPGRHVEQIYLR